MKLVSLFDSKKTILLSLIALLCISMISMNLSGVFGTPLKVVINEIELNPPSSDVDKEWLELYNPTASSIDLTGWKIYTSVGRVFKIPDYTIIPSNSYIVVSFKLVFLNNLNEYVILKDSTGTIIDRSPTLSDTANNDITWQRYPNSKDTDSSADWEFRAMTRGSNNGGESISLNISSSSITIGSPVSLYGSISPAHFALITVQYSHGGSWTDITTVSTSDGDFEVDWAPPGVGSYSLRALLWDGVTSNTVALTVNKISTSLTCMPSLSKIVLMESISLLGSISPKISTPLTLTLTAPNGSALTKSTTTNTEGSFNYTFVPDATGVWYASASWDGDGTHSGSTSDSVSFEVTPPRSPAMAMIFLPLGFIAVAVAVALLFSKSKLQAPPGGVARPQPVRLAKPKRPLLPLRGKRFFQKPKVPTCPSCRTELMFIPQRRRWYCPQCRRYT
ncbi:MAG: lamin tail domain-containing protein [Candidatus Bathyarchaeia archaeon]